MVTLFIDLYESLKYIWNRSLSTGSVDFNLFLTEFELSVGWIGLFLFQINITLIGICNPLIWGYGYVPQILGLDTSTEVSQILDIES